MPPVAMTSEELKSAREARRGGYIFAEDCVVWVVVSAQLVENRGDEGPGHNGWVTDNDGELGREGSTEAI